MTYSTWKKIKTVSVALAFIGFFIILGAAGKSDYMDEIGQYYPFSNTLKVGLVGLLLMAPAFVVGMISERLVWEDDDE